MFIDHCHKQELDDSYRMSLGFGSEPSLSPNESRVVYVGPSDDGSSDGLDVTGFAPGDTMHLPGITTGDIKPLWSPDDPWLSPRIKKIGL